MEVPAILGLSVNTRMLGLAILIGGRLEDYHIQLRKQPWTPLKREQIVASLHPWCTRYTITNIALSIPYETQTSQETKELLQAITKAFKEKRMRVSLYDPPALYELCQKASKTPKKAIMRFLAEQYPELHRLFEKEQRNRNKYYVKLFEAVGVARLLYEKLKK